jgi:hypothetical protein
MGPWNSVEEIRRANVLLPEYWFEPAELKAWYTVIYPTMYDGRYFVTSEKLGLEEERSWTIRYATNQGSIRTHGDFGDYTSLESAVAAAEAIVAKNKALRAGQPERRAS